MFVTGKAAGLNGVSAAIAAGYSPAGAKVAAARMSALPHIKQAIANEKRKASMKRAVGVDNPKTDGTPLRTNYPNGLALLQHAYNNADLPLGIRIDCAKQALPYESAKIGETGKKETAKERAHKVAGTGDAKKAKFGTKQPPKLRIVGGKTS